MAMVLPPPLEKQMFPGLLITNEQMQQIQFIQQQMEQGNAVFDEVADDVPPQQQNEMADIAPDGDVDVVENPAYESDAESIPGSPAASGSYDTLYDGSEISDVDSVASDVSSEASELSSVSTESTSLESAGAEVVEDLLSLL